MKIIITYYNGKYDKDKKEFPTADYETELPLEFGFGSYNEDQIVKNISRKIFVKDIISINPA